MLRDITVQRLGEYLETVPQNTTVMIGCDSTRSRHRNGDWFAHYTTAVVVHIGGRHGCKVFCDNEHSQDYDQNADRPQMRMMNEAMKAVEAYQQLEEILLEYDVEIHLDVNSDPKYGSNCATTAAVGYAHGVTGLPIKIKPFAPAASYAADRGARGLFDHSVHAE